VRVYLTLPQPSRGLQRIADALYNYRPEWAIPVDHEDEADLVIIYVIGRRDHVQRQVERLLSTNRQYAIIQCCLRSTMKPHVRGWEWVWAGAKCVWSYYDLEQAVRNDYEGLNPGSDFQVQQFREHVNFYHAPLGADAKVFRDPFVSERWNDMPHNGRNITVITSGHSRLSESVRECWLAAEEVQGSVIHLGPLKPPAHGMSVTNVTDAELAVHYSASQFVSGLRRTEGFELPAVEGLLCGCRPILFRTPDYLRWYEPWGEFIHEGTRQEVVDQLVELFKRGARPVTETERAEAAMRFNWETIIGGFYERLI
jgi:hypothetical protein